MTFSKISINLTADFLVITMLSGHRILYYLSITPAVHDGNFPYQQVFCSYCGRILHSYSKKALIVLII